MFRDIWITLERFLHGLGGMCLFLLRLLQYTPEVVIRRFRLVVYQVYNAGALSLVVIMISGLFVGGVLALLAHSSLEQFNAEDTTGIFAGLGLVKGIGPATAKKITDVFGTDTLRILEEDPDQLRKVRGLGARKIQELVAATDAQKERWLQPIIAGELQATLAVAEPQSRYELANVATTATRDGDGWVLSGRKGVVLNGGNAQLLIVPARTAGEQTDTSGITLFALEATAAGISCRDYPTVDGLRAGAVAARMWWMLRDLGHERVRVLDGGLPAWTDAGQPTTTEAYLPPPANFTIRPGATRTIDRTGLADRLGEVTLLDARQAERYRGEEEPIDPVAGHIPTAGFADLTADLADGDSPNEFAVPTPERFAATMGALGVGNDSRVVLYDGELADTVRELRRKLAAGGPIERWIALDD